MIITMMTVILFSFDIIKKLHDDSFGALHKISFISEKNCIMHTF
jgi:hypothetical protein